MDFNDYQKAASETAQYPDRFGTYGLTYTTLGLNGEAGEVAEKVKKLLRDKSGQIDEEFVTNLRKELGDVLWYLAETATQLGFTLNDVAEENVNKLRSRKERGVIQGNGDNR